LLETRNYKKHKGWLIIVKGTKRRCRDANCRKKFAKFRI